MSFGRHGKRLFQFFGMSAANIAIVYPAYRIMQKNHEKYLRLPEAEQKRIYDSCPSQKYVNHNDAMSAIQERLLLMNPGDNDCPPRIPYKHR